MNEQQTDARAGARISALTSRYRAVAAAIGALTLVALVTTVLSAQQPAPAPKPAEPTYRELKLENADKQFVRLSDKVTVLSGNVRMVTGDIHLNADKVEYQETTKSATATGNLRILDERNIITGDRCTMDFKAKKCNIAGSVKMVARPKEQKTPDDKSLKSQLKEETTIVCAAIDYFYKDKKAVIASPITITQTHRKITADSATYLGKDELIELTGNVKAVDDETRNTMSTPSARISLKDTDQWIEMEKTTGVFYIKDDDAESKPAQPKSEDKKPAASVPELPNSTK